MAKKMQLLGKKRTVKASVRNRRLAAEYGAKMEELEHIDEAMAEFDEDDEIAAMQYVIKKLEAHVEFVESIFKLSDEEIEKLEDMEDKETSELAAKIMDAIFFEDMTPQEKKKVQEEGKK